MPATTLEELREQRRNEAHRGDALRSELAMLRAQVEDLSRDVAALAAARLDEAAPEALPGMDEDRAEMMPETVAILNAGALPRFAGGSDLSAVDEAVRVNSDDDRPEALYNKLEDGEHLSRRTRAEAFTDAAGTVRSDKRMLFDHNDVAAVHSTLEIDTPADEGAYPVAVATALEVDWKNHAVELKGINIRGVPEGTYDYQMLYWHGGEWKLLDPEPGVLAYMDGVLKWLATDECPDEEA